MRKFRIAIFLYAIFLLPTFLGPTFVHAASAENDKLAANQSDLLYDYYQPTNSLSPQTTYRLSTTALVLGLFGLSTMFGLVQFREARRAQSESESARSARASVRNKKRFSSTELRPIRPLKF